MSGILDKNRYIRNRLFALEMKTQQLKQAQDDYLRNGGYPETVEARSITQSYLSTLFDSIVWKDVAKRHKVRNVTDFGAFVDIGVHQDGLVHISQMAERRVQHPTDVVRVGDIVTVWVMEVDLKRKRISLTMRKPKAQ